MPETQKPQPEHTQYPKGAVEDPQRAEFMAYAAAPLMEQALQEESMAELTEKGMPAGSNPSQVAPMPGVDGFVDKLLGADPESNKKRADAERAIAQAYRYSAGIAADIAGARYDADETDKPIDPHAIHEDIRLDKIEARRLQAINERQQRLAEQKHGNWLDRRVRRPLGRVALAWQREKLDDLRLYREGGLDTDIFQ